MCGPVVYTPVTANARLSEKASECAPKTGGPGSLPPEAHSQWGWGGGQVWELECSQAEVLVNTAWQMAECPEEGHSGQAGGL